MEPFQRSVDHYRVLALPAPGTGDHRITQADVKSAYRRALLHYHPDKSHLKHDTPAHSVDQVKLAFEVLSNSVSRLEYDQRLSNATLLAAPNCGSHPNPETVDLDDLTFDEVQSRWSKGCRCGASKGFTLTQEDLESNIGRGAVIIGCQGCSLWLRVTFAAVEEE